MTLLRRLLVVAALLAVGGCFKLDINPKVNLGGGGGEGNNGGGTTAPQLPSSGSGGWTEVLANVAGQVTLGAEHGAVFYAFDTLAYPKQPAELAVKLRSAKNLQPIPGVTVAIYRDQWLAGRVTTNAEGIA